MIKPLKLIGNKRNVISISSVTAATFINSFIGFVVNLLAAKTFGAEQFGLFALAVTVINMVSIFGDFGIEITLIRLFNKYQGFDSKQNLLLGTIFRFRLFSVIIILVISFPVSFLLVKSLNLNLETLLLFITAFVTSGFFLFWNYLISVLRANRKFTLVSAYTLYYGGFRLAFMAISFIFLVHSPIIWLLATYTVPKTVIVLFGLFRLGISRYKLVSDGLFKVMLKEIISYTKWVALSTIAFNYILSSLRFILAYLVTATAVGVFSAGIIFTQALAIFNHSIRTILFPYVTSLTDQEKIDNYLLKIKMVTPHYFFISVLGIIGLGSFQWVFLGPEYQEALPVFLITSASLALTIFMGFKTMLAHTYMNPEIIAYVNVARLTATIILAFIFVPAFKEIGAAIAYAVPLVIGEFYLCKHIDSLIQKSALNSVASIDKQFINGRIAE